MYISKNLTYIFEHDILIGSTLKRFIIIIIGIPDVYCTNKIKNNNNVLRTLSIIADNVFKIVYYLQVCILLFIYGTHIS